MGNCSLMRGECRWVELDPDDGKPCVNMCALDGHTREEERSRD